MKSIAQRSICLFFFSALSLAGNPIPFINNPLAPTSVAPGTGALTLTVNGGGFVSGSTVNWNGNPLATTFVSSTKLTAKVPAADTQAAGSSAITVTNPGTGATSNMQQFLISAPGSNVFYQNAPNSPYGNFLSPSGLWDFNGDGNLDMLAFSWVPQYDGIMTGSGSGTFGPSTPPNAMVWGYWGAMVGDFNGDGKLDLLGTNSNTTVWPPSGTFRLFWGAGDGTFSPGPTLTVPNGFFVIGTTTSNGVDGATTYDFNGDGNLDLMAVDVSANPPVIQILWGEGDGTFSVGPSTTLPGVFSVVGVADFNGDGKPDLLLGSGQSSDTVNASLEVLLGNGDGTFTPATGATINVGPAAYAVAIADFNGDGKLDIAVPDGINGAPKPGGGQNTPPLAILLGNGDGTFMRVPNCCGTPGLQAHNVVAADLNNDGKLDLAVSISDNPSSFVVSLQGAPPVYIETFLGNGDGTFQPSNYSSLLPSQSLSGADGTIGLYAADLNGDGKLDFVTGDIFNPGTTLYEISVLLQTQPPAQLPDFTIASENSSVAVKAGGTATDNIQIASINGFLSSGVSLALTGCPSSATCTVTQPQGMIIPTSTGSFPLTVVTQACTTASSWPPANDRWPMAAWLGFVLAAVILGQRMRRGERRLRPQRALAWTAITLASLITCGCPANQSQPPPPACVGGTPVGNYTIAVSASSGGITHSASVALVVQ